MEYARTNSRATSLAPLLLLTLPPPNFYPTAHQRYMIPFVIFYIVSRYAHSFKLTESGEPTANLRTASPIGRHDTPIAMGSRAPESKLSVDDQTVSVIPNLESTFNVPNGDDAHRDAVYAALFKDELPRDMAGKKLRVVASPEHRGSDRKSNPISVVYDLPIAKQLPAAVVQPAWRGLASYKGCLDTRGFRMMHVPPKIHSPPQHLFAENIGSWRRVPMGTAKINPNGPEPLPEMIKLRPPTPSRPVNWREAIPKQLNRILDLDMSRIDSDYIISKETMHDINDMLEVIEGWQLDRVIPYMESFQRDPENKGRCAYLIDFARRTWVVKIENPMGWTWRPPICQYGYRDIPLDCQVYGCGPGCPRPDTRLGRYMSMKAREPSLVIHQRKIYPIREGSRISSDLPRIFGKQSHPLPAIKWDLLGYKGLKGPVVPADRTEPRKDSCATNVRPRPGEKRTNRFETCSLPKKRKEKPDGSEVVYIERLEPDEPSPGQPPASPRLAHMKLPDTKAALFSLYQEDALQDRMSDD